jgi:hypothetical protein
MESSLVKKPTSVIVGAARNRRRAGGLCGWMSPFLCMLRAFWAVQ